MRLWLVWGRGVGSSNLGAWMLGFSCLFWIGLGF